MIRFDLTPGDIAEDAVQEAIEKAFSPAFVFRSPSKIGRNQLTDVLVLFDDIGLIIESKARHPLVKDTSERALKWAEDKINEALPQISNAIKAIQGGQVPFVQNTFRGRIPLEKARFPWLYGLIILQHESFPYNPYECVPALGKCEFPVHVLSFSDFWNLAHYLDTPADLINYFEHRSDVLLPTLHPKVHNEREVFGYYVRNLDKCLLVRAKAKGLKLTDKDVKPYADKLRTLIGGRCPNSQAGYLIDHLLDQLLDRDPLLDVIGNGGASDNANEIITAISQIPRVRRIDIGSAFLRIAKLAKDAGVRRYKAIYSKARNECTLLLASPLPRQQRGQRIEELRQLALLAQVYYQVNRVIGIATEPAGQMGHSYDVLLLEGPPLEDKEARSLGQRIFGDHPIGSETT